MLGLTLYGKCPHCPFDFNTGKYWFEEPECFMTTCPRCGEKFATIAFRDKAESYSREALKKALMTIGLEEEEEQ